MIDGHLFWFLFASIQLWRVYRQIHKNPSLARTETERPNSLTSYTESTCVSPSLLPSLSISFSLSRVDSTLASHYTRQKKRRRKWHLIKIFVICLYIRSIGSIRRWLINSKWIHFGKVSLSIEIMHGIRCVLWVCRSKHVSHIDKWYARFVSFFPPPSASLYFVESKRNLEMRHTKEFTVGIKPLTNWMRKLHN